VETTLYIYKKQGSISDLGYTDNELGRQNMPESYYSMPQEAK